MLKKLMLGTALSALLLSGALAQSSTAPERSARISSTQAQPSGRSDFIQSQKPDQWLASKFKGTDVMDADNQKIGDVSDILFDKTGKIEAFVISVGGFLGMGAKDVALSPSSFDVISGQNGAPDKLKLAMSQGQLKEAQNFKPYQPPRATTGMAPGGLPTGLRPPPYRPPPGTGQ